MHKRLRISATYLLLGVLLIWSLVPLFVMLSTSFKPGDEIFSIPPRWLPVKPTLENYYAVLFESSMPRYFVNSMLIGLLTTLISMVVGCMAGYGFARYSFKGRRLGALFMLISQLLPLTVLLVPMYLLLLQAGLIDTYLGLALSHLTLTLPLVSWMSMNYFESIPKALEEAAQIDGCSQWEAVWRIVLPLTLPGLISIALFAFLMSWNEFVLTSVFSITDATRTLPIGLTEFASMFKVDWGSTMAASTLITLPVVMAFLFFQKYFVQGLAAGAVKE